MSSPCASAGPAQRYLYPRPVCRPICLGYPWRLAKMWGCILASSYCSRKASTSKRQSVYVTSTPGLVDLKIGISNLAGASHFLSLHPPVASVPTPMARSLTRSGVSITESGAPLSGEEGGKPPPPTVVCWDFGGQWGSPEGNVNELVTVRESVCLGPFQTEIIEGRVKPLLRYTSYVMITSLRAEGRPRETRPLPLGLHVLHAYTRLKNGSGRVSLVVRNVSDRHIFLKKGVLVARVVSASLVQPTELSPEMEAALGVESRPKPMLVAARQEKLLEKSNLDGLAHWSPENAVVARELVLAYHDVFALESNELGCTSVIEHKICIENDEPFKEWFRRIPPPLLEEVCASLRDMLEAGAIHLSQSPWYNAVVLVWKKDGTLHFCVDFRHLNARTKKDLYPLPQIQEALESMAGLAHFLQWTSNQAYGRSRWLQDPNSTWPLRWVTSGSMSLPACCSVCATLP